MDDGSVDEVDQRADQDEINEIVNHNYVWSVNEFYFFAPLRIYFPILSSRAPTSSDESLCAEFLSAFALAS